MNISNYRRAQQLVERNLGVIGEAMHRIERADPETARHIPERHQIIGLRNRLAHGYGDEIDHTIIWEATQHFIPDVQTRVETLMPAFED